MIVNTTLDQLTYALAVDLGWYATGSVHHPWPQSFWHRLDTALPDCRPHDDGTCWHSIRPSFPDEQVMPNLRNRAVELLRRTLVEEAAGDH